VALLNSVLRDMFVPVAQIAPKFNEMILEPFPIDTDSFIMKAVNFYPKRVNKQINKQIHATKNTSSAIAGRRKN